jgi:hypothetical protein
VPGVVVEQLDHPGTGGPATRDVVVPYGAFAGGELRYEMRIDTWANVFTDGPAVEMGELLDVTVVSDFEHTGRLAQVRVFDTAAVDVTDQVTLRFASQQAAVVPEPATVALTAIGLLALGVGPWARARRKRAA